jgi:glutathione S-transferase
MKLYSGPLSMFGAKVEIAAREKRIPFTLVLVPFGQKQGYTPKHPEVLRINPKRQVPLWVDDDVELFDSTQILEYLEHRWPTPPLWPALPAARARARLLEHACDELFFPLVMRLMRLRTDPDPIDSTEWQSARAGIEEYYRKMEKVLQGQDYLAGEYTHADIAFYMAQFFAARHTVPLTEAHANLLVWRARIGRRPAVQQVIGALAGYLQSIHERVPAYA